MPAAEMAGHSNKLNGLLEVFHIDLQPSKIGSAHVCGDDARAVTSPESGHSIDTSWATFAPKTPYFLQTL